MLPRIRLFKLEKMGVNQPIAEPLKKRFKLFNTLNSVIGFLVLLLIMYNPNMLSVALKLLCIGLYFLLQISPLTIIRHFLEVSSIQNQRMAKPVRLSRVVPPATIIAAIILFISYLSISLLKWNLSANTQLLQMIIYVGVNAYLVFSLATIAKKIKRSSGEEKKKLISFFKKAAPLFVYLSAGISIYYFGKMLIARYDLHEFRPAMMSIALTAVGMAVYSIIWPTRSN